MNAFDEIARKNCPTTLEFDYYNSEFVRQEDAVEFAARLAQATMEATREHEEFICYECACEDCCYCSTCQSDILQHTEEKLK